MKKVVKHVVFVLVVAIVAFAGMTLMHMRRTSEISKASFVSERYGHSRHEKIKGYSEWCRSIMQRDDFNEIKAVSTYNDDGTVKAYAFCKEENGRKQLIAFVRYDQFMDWMNSVEDHLYDKVHEVAIPVADWMGIF